MAKVSETDSKYIWLPVEMKSLHRNYARNKGMSLSQQLQTDQTFY